MFGNNAFGRPATATPSAFGSFGNANANTTTPVGNTTGTGASPFGNTATNSNTATTNPLFGGRPASSIFGNPAANTAQPSAGTPGGGTSLFGSFGQNQSTQQGTNTTPAALTGSNLFGNTSTATQPTTNLFGQPQQPTNAQPATGFFGQPTQQPAASMGTSLFGQPAQSQPQPTNSLFGQLQTSQPAQPSTNLFGNLGQSTAANATPNMGLFGAQSTTTAPSLFGYKPLGQSQAVADSAQAQFASLTQKIEGIQQAWDPASPQCRFQHFFYNLVDRNQVHLYGRPPNAASDALWQKAVRENPDPSCYVPALAVGFDDLQRRVEAQKAQASAHQEKIKELKTRITTLANSHSTTNTPRLQRAAAVQTQLQQRLVRLVQHLHLLIPSVRSSSIRPEEDALRSMLENLNEEVRRPGGVGRLKGKLNELWAMIGAIETAREREQTKKDSSVEWAVVDPEGLQRLTQVLAEQQNGIAHLTKIVQDHQKDLDIILGKPAREREQTTLSDPQSNQLLSTSLLGRSTI